MLTKVQTNFENILQNLGRQGQIYIVPTLDGLKLLVLNLILLIIGLVYANNYVLLFNFILFCLFIASMYYTHFNLQGLKLSAIRFNPLHAGESGHINLTFQSKSSLGHYFLTIHFKSDLIGSGDNTFSFSIQETQSIARVALPITSLKRGTGSLKRISVETRFPFHLFRAFTYYDINLALTIYPENKALGLHHEKTLAEESLGNEEDFYLKDYQPGDSLKRVQWKKLAQSGKMLTKQTTSNQEQPIVLCFSSDTLSSTDKENELSSICFGLHERHSQNLNYGLMLDTLSIEPGHSQLHLQRCLKALAEYEN